MDIRAVGAIAAIVLASPSRTPAEETGRIYVYAQRLTIARSWLKVSCSGVLVAELKRGTFFAINVPPGRHSLSTVTGVPLSIEVRPSEEAFVRLDWHYEVGRVPIPVFTNIDPDQARKEMAYLSYIDLRKVLSNSVSTRDPRAPLEPRLKRRAAQ